MMDFITVPLVVGIVFLGVYSLFDLFVRKKERLSMIEKIGDRFELSACDEKIGLPRFPSHFSFSSLKAGCLLAGIGLGLLVGFIISMSLIDFNGENWRQCELVSTVYGASVLLCGGISLIVAFIIEMKLSKEKK